jgi:hypothetical protein
MSDAEILRGGCLCGAVRYEATGAPLWVVHCHCVECRRACGAAFATWAGYRATRVRFTTSTPKTFASSPDVIRRFCETCGTPLSYESTRFPGELHLMTGTFDAPNLLTPTGHVWTDEALPWALHEDGFKRRPRGPAPKPQS